MEKIEVADDDMREEYDLSKLTGKVRGKYVNRYRVGTNQMTSALDIAGIDLGISTEEIVEIVREGRERV